MRQALFSETVNTCSDLLTGIRRGEERLLLLPRVILRRSLAAVCSVGTAKHNAPSVGQQQHDSPADQPSLGRSVIQSPMVAYDRLWAAQTAA